MKDLKQSSNQSTTIKQDLATAQQPKLAVSTFAIEDPSKSPLLKMELNDQNLKDVKSFLTKRRSARPAMTSLPSGKHFTQQSRTSL